MWGDVRKGYKLTASYVIALAIKLYLDEIINGVDLPYNYLQFYLTRTKYNGNACINTIIWGMPDRKTLIQLTET